MRIIIILFFLFSCITEERKDFLRTKNPFFEYQESKPYLNIDLSWRIPSQGLGHFRLLIDTGSDLSLINEKYFPNIRKKTLSFRTLSGTITSGFGETLTLIRFPDSEKGKRQRFTVAEFPVQFDFDGILGNDFLSNFHVFLHIPEEVVLLEKHESHEFLTKNFDSQGFEVRTGHIVLEMFVNQKKAYLIFDTGATVSLISSKFFSNETRWSKTEYSDMSGKKYTGSRGKIQSVCLKNLCKNNLSVLKTEDVHSSNLLSDSNADGILGVDWMESFQILLDYETRNIFIKSKQSFQ